MIGHKKILGLVACALMAVGGEASAQSPENVQFIAAPAPEMQDSGAIHEFVRFEGFEGEIGLKTVTGAPFSASFSTETTQTLADGNHIRQSSAGTLARDAQGRTRRDLTMSGLPSVAKSNKSPMHVIFLTDPVAGTHYVLNPDSKTAMSVGRHSNDGNVFYRRFDGASREQTEAGVTRTSLGTQTIGGIAAEGTRITRTIPAGAMGNEQPITIVMERWYSSELQTVVLSKHSDPRMGDSVFQLSDIQRAAPEESLFQVPPDYTVTQPPRPETLALPPTE
jgi:hypothetical protein